MTANVFKSDIEKCLNAGMDGHLHKPVDTERLFETLHSYLGKNANNQLYTYSLAEDTPKNEETEAGLKQEDLAFLRERLHKVKTACEVHDAKEAENIILELKKRQWPESANNLLEITSGHLLFSGFDEVIKIVNNFVHD